jgi:hypothetical protein
MSKLIYELPAANLKQTIQAAIEVESEMGMEPVQIEVYGKTLKYTDDDALRLMGDILTELEYIERNKL